MRINLTTTSVSNYHLLAQTRPLIAERGRLAASTGTKGTSSSSSRSSEAWINQGKKGCSCCGQSHPRRECKRTQGTVMIAMKMVILPSLHSARSQGIIAMARVKVKTCSGTGYLNLAAPRTLDQMEDLRFAASLGFSATRLALYLCNPPRGTFRAMAWPRQVPRWPSTS